MPLFARESSDRSLFSRGPSQNEGPVVDQGILIPSLTRNVPRMLVSRMQDHMVETSNGDIHMVVNLGGDRSIVILTSTDDGDSWSISNRYPDAATNSSSDVRLIPGEDTMLMVYVNENGGITYNELTYNEDNTRWRVTETSEVVASGLDPASTNPTIAQGGNGALLVAYNINTDDGVRGVLAGSTNGQNWVLFDELDSEASAGSLRAVGTGDGFGVIYVTAEHTYWIEFEDGAFTFEEIADEGAVGIYASHFTTTTVGEDIFFAGVGEDLALNFMHYDGASDTWSEAEVPSGAGVDIGDVSSVQLSADADGDLFLTYDDYDTGLIHIITSDDEGETWSDVATLDVPDFLRSDPARFEAPEHFDGDLVVAYQFAFPLANGLTGLYYFVVDTETDTVTTGIAPEGTDLALL
ncbi:hypothetical protein [Acuticoccus yangtzensis]|uniref:hypothetical protein n=1 Tax=Acuticoccus yangtzensis TaxID=1443441 RepID=UPI00094969B5|nr:hypothetical protein [Acuticoccus yangtzensis]